jgi:hypothetical protein
MDEQVSGLNQDMSTLEMRWWLMLSERNTQAALFGTMTPTPAPQHIYARNKARTPEWHNLTNIKSEQSSGCVTSRFKPQSRLSSINPAACSYSVSATRSSEESCTGK